MKAISGLFLSLLLFSCGNTVNCVDNDLRDPLRVCSPNWDPVCGCNDVTYTNSCYAEKEGLVSWIGGPCP